MGRTGIDVLDAPMAQECGCLGNRAPGVDLVVKDDGVSAIDGADEIKVADTAVFWRAALFDDGQRQVEGLGKVSRPAAGPDVGCYDGGVRHPFFAEIVDEHVARRQFVTGDIKESLDLPGVEIENQETVRPGYANDFGHQPGGDGHSRLVLLVGAAVGKIRHHGRDPPCRVTPQGIDEHQELEDVVVDRGGHQVELVRCQSLYLFGHADTFSCLVSAIAHPGAGRLDKKHIFAAHTFSQLGKDVAIGKLADGDLAQAPAKFVRDFLRQLWIGRAAQDRQGAVEPIQLSAVTLLANLAQSGIHLRLPPLSRPPTVAVHSARGPDRPANLSRWHYTTSVEAYQMPIEVS